ncbi:MAG: hypothetical protein HDR11_09780 [Lachnospiraceae bacterium]|nr:hypothetical protein [Lachnospiraceae bacterium]
MKARFKRTKTSDGLPLLAGKMYNVLDVKRGKDGAIEKIRVKNEKGEEEWYKANKFLLFAEAERYIDQTADNMAQQLTASRHIGIDLASGADMMNYIDMTAASMAKKQIEIGKAVGEAFIKGLMDRQGLEYGA